jgi:hypothetical protein
MRNLTETLKINLNQNLWGLVVSYGFLGISEYYKLCTLFWFSVIPAAAMAISICFTTYAYTKNYVNNKIQALEK